MSSKRHSLLFPFRSEKKPEAKFEVVNRKRSPLAAGGQATSAAPATSSTKTTAATSTRHPTPFDDVARKLTSQSQQPRSSHANRPAAGAATSSSKNKLKAANSIRLADAPLANLNVNVDVPPVPDYNSRSFAPPVTIQGRSVSLAKKDAPPRRKPPTVAENKTLHEQAETAPIASPVPNITVDQTSSQEEFVAERPIVFRKKSHESLQQSTHSPALSRQTTQQSVEQESLSSFHAQIPGAFPSISRPHTPEPSSPAPLSKAPLYSPSYVAPPSIATETQNSNRSSYISQNSRSEFFDADDTMDRSTPNLNQSKTSFDAFSFQEESSVQTPIVPESTTVEEARPDLRQNYSVESLGQNSIDSFAGSEISYQSVVKPLNFHKKTVSEVSNSTVIPEASTHKKKLSLSDEIMRDIDNFRPGGLQSDGTTTQEEDEFSPITPLQMGPGTELPDEIKIERKGLSDEFDDDFDSEGSITHTLDGGTPKLQLANADSTVIPVDEGSLFQDSSDDDMSGTEGAVPMLDPLTGLQAPVISEDFGASTTSVAAEVDFVQTPGMHFDGTIDRGILDEEDDDQSSYRQANTGIPRSPSYDELYGELSGNKGTETPPYPTDGLVPETPTSSTQQGTSPYSYHQSPERRTFRVMNDATSPRSIAGSSRYEADSIAVTESSIDERPRTFHVVNDGKYSDSDSDSFDANGSEQINQDFSVVRQEDLNLNLAPPSINEESSGEALSFTARSPINSEFNIGSPPKVPYGSDGLNFSDSSLSNSGGVITPQRSSLTPDHDSRSEYSDSFPTAQTVAQPVYDTRIEEKAAPVQNLGQFQGKSRRPPPGGALAVPTRVARSTSISAPTNNYNSIKEDEVDTPVAAQHHVPQVSSYIEMLRLGGATTNTNVRAEKWGLPIGIAEIDHSRFVSSASKAIYKRPTRLQKNDLKHGKIKQRQLALEVGDDEDDDVPTMGTSEKRESMELKRFETQTSLPASIGSPPASHIGDMSPKKEDKLLNRSGTLLIDKVPQTVNVGRTGTVREKAPMTLFIANPDVDSD